MLMSGEDILGVPTATLREILKDSKGVHESARVEDAQTREIIALYLHAFDLDSEALSREHKRGIYALNKILESGTYQGFVGFFDSQEYDPEKHQGINPVDYRIGLKQAGEMYDKDIKRVLIV